jgi:MazG family protein
VPKVTGMLQCKRIVSRLRRRSSAGVPLAVAGACPELAEGASRPRPESRDARAASISACSRSLPPDSTLIYIGSRMSSTGERFERAVAIMERLRAPGGCPWDREQTFDSIKPYTLEETYEVLEAIDNRDWPELAGELGDLLLQVLFYAEMANEQSSFSIDDVLDRLSTKLINRHPHVFGDVKADTSAEVKRNWEALKVEERKKRQASGGEGDAAAAQSKDQRQSILAGVSSAMPSLLEASKLSSRAAQAGFDWPNVEGLFDKLTEETNELREELREFPAPGPRPQGLGIAGSGRTAVPENLQARLEDEVGDLFFVLVNIARYLSVDPESALRKSNRKFKRRFQWLEARLHESGRSADQAPMEELESLWQQAKAEENRGV